MVPTLGSLVDLHEVFGKQSIHNKNFCPLQFNCKLSIYWWYVPPELSGLAHVLAIALAIHSVNFTQDRRHLWRTCVTLKVRCGFPVTRTS